MAKKYTRVVPVQKETWKPEKEGEKLIGILTDKESGVGANNSWLYSIEKEDGEILKVWGSAALDPRMELIPIGKEVEIEFFGLKKNPTTGRSYKAFEIGVSEE